MTKHWIYKYNLLMFDKVGSTNEEALRLVYSGAKGDYAIFAKQQIARREGHYKQLYAPEGNFYLSLLLEPVFTVESGVEMYFVAVLAVKEAITYTLGIDLNINFQWPNDVLLNGKKICEITLEFSSASQKNIPDWFVISIEINVMHFPTEVEFNATSLKNEGCGEVPCDLLLNEFMKSFVSRYNVWRNRGFNTLKLEWMSSAFNLNKPITVIFRGEKISGVFKGIDKVGSLLLSLADGQLKTIIVSEVLFEQKF